MENFKVCFPFGKMKAVTMSFDDGKTADRRLVKLLERYNLKGTFFLNSGQMHEVKEGKNEGYYGAYIPKCEIKKLYKNKEVGCHTLTHPRLTNLTIEEVYKEVMEDKLELEVQTNNIISGFSYPFGAYNNEIKEVLKSIGILYARTVNDIKDFTLPKDLLEWHPTCHFRKGGLELAKEFINIKSKEPKLYYLWGHSYELDGSNLWDLIEEIFKIISNDKDIWYETNYNVAEYLKACKRLVISQDGNKIYNPSNISVWIIKDNKIIEILGGMFYEQKR